MEPSPGVTFYAILNLQDMLPDTTRWRKRYYWMRTTDPSTAEALEELQALPVIDTTRLVQERLILFIRSNGLGPGDKLPSEHQLATRLGIGRPALREALRSLQALGLIEVRAGSGWYATAPSFDALARHLVLSLEPSAQTHNELHRIRGILESAFLEEAVEGLTPDDVVSLRKLVAKMERLAMGGQSYAEQDRDFHTLLFSHVTNDFFHRFVRACWTLCLAWIPFEPPATQDRQIAVAGRHRQILDAVGTGDLDAARGLLEVHAIRDHVTPRYSENC